MPQRFRREHLRLQQRSHYVIPNGGDQPNVVPPNASVWYYFREVSYPEIIPPYAWNTLAPRTGVVIKLTADGKNVVKASYSRYYESMYTSEYASINPNSIQTSGIQTGRSSAI